MKNALGLLAAFLSVGYYLLIVYRVVDADGSWYNDLYQEYGRENVGFRQKLYFTVLRNERKLSYKRTVLTFVLLPLVSYVFVRVVVAGLMNF